MLSDMKKQKQTIQRKPNNKQKEDHVVMHPGVVENSPVLRTLPCRELMLRNRRVALIIVYFWRVVTLSIV